MESIVLLLFINGSSMMIENYLLQFGVDSLLFLVFIVYFSKMINIQGEQTYKIFCILDEDML